MLAVGQAAPEALRETEDRIETLRDFSHVKNRSFSEFEALFRSGNMKIVKKNFSGRDSFSCLELRGKRMGEVKRCGWVNLNNPAYILDVRGNGACQAVF